MAHSLILGMTQSGKSTLAKMLTAELARRGRLVMILDPMLDSGWPEKSLVVSEPEELHRAAAKMTGAHIFVDEAAVHVGRSQKMLSWIFRFGSHWGHSANLITQHPTDLAPFVRSQCTSAYVFKSTAAVGELLRKRDGFRGDALLDIEEIPKYHFLMVDRYNPPRFLRLVRAGAGFAVAPWEVDAPPPDPDLGEEPTDDGEEIEEEGDDSHLTPRPDDDTDEISSDFDDSKSPY